MDNSRKVKKLQGSKKGYDPYQRCPICQSSGVFIVDAVRAEFHCANCHNFGIVRKLSQSARRGFIQRMAVLRVKAYTSNGLGRQDMEVEVRHG